MAIKIGIFGVNDGMEEYEKKVIDFLGEELKKHDIELKDYSSFSVPEMLEEGENKAILICDSVKRNNVGFSKICKELWKNKVIPLVLITHVESDEADPESAFFDAGVAAQYVDPNVDVFWPDYKAVFFNFDKKGAYSVLAEPCENSINDLVESINLYTKASKLE